MNIGKYVPTVATLIVAAVVMAGVAFPMIGNLSSETTTISNDGASWIRMAYITDQSDYSVEYTFGDNVSVAGQSGEWGDMILYADSQCTICIVGDYLVKIVGDVAYASDDPQTVTVSRSSGIVSIDGEPVSESTVSWAYVPVANGKYSSFGADTVPLHRNSALATVGGFAGVYAYNENVSMDLGFVMDADVTEEYINSVRWALESDIPVEETQPFHPIGDDEFDPSVFDPSSLTPIDIDPINPIDPNENQLMSVPTPTYTDGDWGYELETVSGVQKAKIVSYSGAGGGAITIPATVGGYDVYSVGLGTVVGNVPQTVFSDTLTATDLIISSGIIKINNYAFQGCSGFTGTLTIPNTVTSIGVASFRSCSGFTGTLTIPSSVTTIYAASFRGCTGFSALVLNEGLTRMEAQSTGEGCFAECTGLTGTLTLPSTLTYLSNAAFKGCIGLTGVVFNSAPATQSVSNSIGGIFSGCTGLTGTITLPSGIQLGGYDFYGCTGITGVVLPSGMTYIPNGAFQNCTGITSLSIPSTVTTIQRNAFNGCSGITGTLSLPTGLTSIGASAFSNCTHISGQLVLPSGLTTLDAGAFNGCSGITGDIYIPNGVTSIQTVFKGCTGITGVNFNNVTTIGTETFFGCTGLTGTLEIPSTVQTIGRGAFYGCTGLTGLILNEGLVSLTNTSPSAQGAFYGCTGLTGTLVIPSTVTTIGYRTFVSTNFTNLIILSDAIPATATGMQYPENFSDTTISQVLNLSNNEWTTTSYGLEADEVRSDIAATSYMAPVSISETTTREGPTFDLLAILPIVFVAGLLLTTAWLFIRK